MFDITNIMHEGDRLMKKKLLTVLLTISMAVSVVACGNGEGAGGIHEILFVESL